MNGWIDCRERLPEPEVDVEVWLEKGSGKAGVVTAGLFYDGLDSDRLKWMGWENEEPFRSTWQVTHWRPLLGPHRPTWLAPNAENCL